MKRKLVGRLHLVNNINKQNCRPTSSGPQNNAIPPFSLFSRCLVELADRSPKVAPFYFTHTHTPVNFYERGKLATWNSELGNIRASRNGSEICPTAKQLHFWANSQAIELGTQTHTHTHTLLARLVVINLPSARLKSDDYNPLTWPPT